MPVEIGLLAIFLLHVYKAITNYVAQPARRGRVGYATKKRAGHTSRKSLASSTMIWSGLVVLLFVIIHVKQFKFGACYSDGSEAPIRDLARTEIEVFSHPGLGRVLRDRARCSSACTCATASRAASSRSASIIRVYTQAAHCLGHRAGDPHRRRPRDHPGLGVSDALLSAVSHDRVIQRQLQR